jgi:hypothetical protein
VTWRSVITRRVVLPTARDLLHARQRGRLPVTWCSGTAQPLSLEKIDDTLIEVIARVHDLHLALMFKVLDDLAARQNLLCA